MAKRDSNANADKPRAVRIPDSLWKSLEDISNDYRGLTPSELVRVACEDLVAWYKTAKDSERLARLFKRD